MRLKQNPRSEGACSLCARRKRKCDQTRPQCSLCQKLGAECILQTFRNDTVTSQARKRTTKKFISHRRPCDAQSCEASTSGSSPGDDEPEGWSNTDSYTTVDSERVDTVSQHDLTSSMVPLQSVQLPVASERLGGLDTRFLWNYFTRHLVKVFLIWEPSTNIDYKDPYSASLPIMALRTPASYYAAMAATVMHYSAITRQTCWQGVQRQFEQQALDALVKQQASLAEDANFHLNTGLCIQLLCLSAPRRYARFLPLARSATACLLKSTSRDTVEPDEFAIAMMMQRWSDIYTLCSVGIDVPTSDESMHQLIEADAGYDDLGCPAAGSFLHIHPLYGLSRQLIKPFMKLARLIHARKIRCTDDAYIFDPLLEQEIDHLEYELLQICKIDPPSSNSTSPVPDDLRHINQAYAHTAHLLLCTRLRDFPWTSQRVRKLINAIFNEISHLKRSSRVSHGIGLPLFFAGCESVDSTMRDAILQEIRHMPGIFLNREQELIVTLRAVWAIRDEKPGAPWTEWNQLLHSDTMSYFVL